MILQIIRVNTMGFEPNPPPVFQDLFSALTPSLTLLASSVPANTLL